MRNSRTQRSSSPPRAPPLATSSATLRDYAEGINASPERLAEIEDRLALLDRLKRKYGATIAEVIAFGEEVARKLAEVEDRDEILKALRADLNQAASAYKKAAAALTVERKAAAAKLAKLAETQINSLAMKVRFEIALAANEADTHWTAHGWDEVEYRIATNPGEPLKPLHEIASGGEMSRVMLALKVAVEEHSSKTNKKIPTPRTLVFDEIDIGIGGRAAEAVGQKLKALARGQQVLCVTHLPQIAAFAGTSTSPSKSAKTTAAPKLRFASSTTAPAPTKSRACSPAPKSPTPACSTPLR